jgi:hypothetical protein
MKSRSWINIHTCILCFVNTYNKKTHPVQSDMVMHTKVCTVWESNPRPLDQKASTRTTALNHASIHTYMKEREMCCSSFLTYLSRFIPKGVTKTSQIYHLDTRILPKYVCYENYCSGKPIDFHRSTSQV